MRLLALLVLPLAACAATPDTRGGDNRSAAASAGLERELAGLMPGQPTTCLPPYRQTQIKAYGATIVYVVDRRLKYRTDTAGGCEGIAREDILVTRSLTGQTCRGDIAQTVDRASQFPTGSCSFGDFVPYRAR